jgi:hypothetical protein
VAIGQIYRAAAREWPHVILGDAAMEIGFRHHSCSRAERLSHQPIENAEACHNDVSPLLCRARTEGVGQGSADGITRQEREGQQPSKASRQGRLATSGRS